MTTDPHFFTAAQAAGALGRDARDALLSIRAGGGSESEAGARAGEERR